MSRVMKALFGHALCEPCLAQETALPLMTVHESLRSIETVLMIGAVRPCGRCGSNVNVHGIPEPHRQPSL